VSIHCSLHTAGQQQIRDKTLSPGSRVNQKYDKASRKRKTNKVYLKIAQQISLFFIWFMIYRED